MKGINRRPWGGSVGALLLLTNIAACTEADTITLGATLQLTGSLAGTGRYYRDAYQITVDKINETGGIALGDIRYKLALKILDNVSDPDLPRGSRRI